jgi:hypothetical protein
LQGLLKEGKHYASFKEFCKDSPGVAAAYRAIELRIKSEARFKEETHDAQGLRLVQAKEALRRVSHMGSLQDIEDHWECIMGTEQETRQPQFFGTLLMDVHRSLELVYAQNLEILEALNRTARGVVPADARTSLSERSLKGTLIAKEVRDIAQVLLLEQPFALRGGPKERLLDSVCASGLLWSEMSLEEKVCFSHVYERVHTCSYQ